MNLRRLTFTYRGLTLYELYGGYYDLVQRRLCGLRGHRWGPWWLEAEDYDYGPATRMCERCTAYEERNHA